MGDYSVAANDVAVHAKTLVASTVDTVTFGSLVEHVEVISDGAAAIHVTVDGSTPTVNGANTYILPAGVVSLLKLQNQKNTAPVVKLISIGTPTYSVQAAE